MSVNELVQVGSTMWLRPQDIRGVRWVEPHPALIGHDGKEIIGGHDGYTQIVHQDATSYMPTTCYLTSDWPMARVQSALGLVSADDLERML